MLGVNRTAALEQGSAPRARGTICAPPFTPMTPAGTWLLRSFSFPQPLPLHRARVSLSPGAAVASPDFIPKPPWQAAQLGGVACPPRATRTLHATFSGEASSRTPQCSRSVPLQRHVKEHLRLLAPLQG